MGQINVVVGPLAAGKTTFVTENKNDGDVVVDFDALCCALGASSPHEADKDLRAVAAAARIAAIARINEGIEPASWIIASAPSKSQIEKWITVGARFHVIAPGLEENLERSRRDDRPDGTEGKIRQWYENPPQIPEALIETPSEWKPSQPKGTPKMRVKAVTAKIKAPTDEAALKEGEFLAYASTFVRTPDAYGDVVARGAFEKTLTEWKESGLTLPVLYAHRMDDPDYNIGAVLEAKEDEHGLLVKGRLDLGHPKAASVYRLIKGRRLNQLSFAFDVIDEGRVELESGQKANELRQLRLYEISLVPLGANQTTEVVAVKTAAEVLAHSVKEGRTLTEANEETIREAVETLSSVSRDLENVLTGTGAESDEDPDVDEGEVTPKDPASGNPSVPKGASGNPSAKERLALLLEMSIAGIPS